MNANSLVRNQTIRIYPKGNDRFEVRDRRGQLKLAADDKFHIYFKRVEFNHEEGYVRGTYLGETDGKLRSNLDTRIENHDNQWVSIENRPYELARLASVENGNGLVVIIEEE